MPFAESLRRVLLDPRLRRVGTMAPDNSTMNYATAASRHEPSTQTKTPVSQVRPPAESPQTTMSIHRRRSASPSHIPKAVSENEQVFVLTILTDKAHHDRMTELRRKYFPAHLNKLAAHLTLFHALPESRLKTDIVPALETVAARTSRFRIRAQNPFRLKKGIAVSISKGEGGEQGKRIHRELQDVWKPERFLSDQDAGGCSLHYTVMNKVDDQEAVDVAFKDLKANWTDDDGVAEGLALWRYDRGFWRWERKFDLRDSDLSE